MELLAAALKGWDVQERSDLLGDLEAAAHKGRAPVDRRFGRNKRIECSRSLERGIGPAKRAAVGRLEAPPGRWEPAGTADRARIDVAVVGAMWLLRGAEVAAILVEQAEVAQDEKSACLRLGPTKTTPSGKECQRILRCACRSGDDLFIGTRVCPVHALQRIVRRQVAAGFTSKHPIVSGSDGLHFHQSRPETHRRRPWYPGRSPSTPCEECAHSSTHAEASPCPLCKYSAATIEKYVADALAEKASWAPLAAARTETLPT